MYALVRQNQEVNPKKKLIKTGYGIELVHTVVVRIGIHHDRMYPIELVIDTKIPTYELVLGMPALKVLGYRITVAGQETRERPATKKVVRVVSKKKSERKLHARVDSTDDVHDKISFLDEEEARRIREWEY